MVSSVDLACSSVLYWFVFGLYQLSCFLLLVTIGGEVGGE